MDATVRSLKALQLSGLLACKNEALARLPRQWQKVLLDLKAMSRPIVLAIGISLTAGFAAVIAFLLFFAEQLYSVALLSMVILFQLSFIWSVAELIDSLDETRARNDSPDHRPQGAKRHH